MGGVARFAILAPLGTHINENEKEKCMWNVKI